jgi:hypothetical protein
VDIEKTIEFILASEARLQARFEASEERAAAEAERTKVAAAEAERAKAGAARAEAAAVRAEAEMAAIRETLQQTAFIQQEQARILVRIEKNVEEISQAHKDLALAQQHTDATLKAFIESLRHGKNGSNGGKP